MITQGIRQGDCLNPTLFNIIVDQITNDSKQIQRGSRLHENSMIFRLYHILKKCTQLYGLSNDVRSTPIPDSTFG